MKENAAGKIIVVGGVLLGLDFFFQETKQRNGLRSALKTAIY